MSFLSIPSLPSMRSMRSMRSIRSMQSMPSMRSIPSFLSLQSFPFPPFRYPFYFIGLRAFSFFFFVFILFLGACTKKSSTASRRGNVFIRNLGGEPTSLHPIIASDLYSRRVHDFVLDKLLVLNPDTYHWEPGLARTYTISPDKKVFTFELRKDAFFHDGKPVTAEDVQFSFDAIFEPQYHAANMQPYYSGIKKVEVLGPHKVRFITKTKFFLNFYVAAGLDVIPKHIYQDVEKSKKMNHEIVGSGPYKLKKYDRGRRLVLEKFEKWYGDQEKHLAPRYRFQEIIMRFIKEDEIALKMIEKGDLDFIGLSGEQFITKTSGKNWGKKILKFKVENYGPKGYSYVGWNLENPLFKDRNIRLGLAHLLNRQAINEKFRHNMSFLQSGPFYPKSEYADPSVKPLEFDIKKGLAYFRKSGWSDSDKDGFLDKKINGKKTPFRFTLIYPNKQVERYWTLYKEDLKKAGVDLQIRYMEWNAFMKILDERKFEAVVLAWGGGTVDWTPKQIWHSSSTGKGGSNFVQYKNKQVDAWIDLARQEYDKSKRIKILRKAYKQIASDAPYLFLFSNQYDLYAHRQRIQKLKDTFKYEIGLSYWYVKDNVAKAK